MIIDMQKLNMYIFENLIAQIGQFVLVLQHSVILGQRN